MIVSRLRRIGPFEGIGSRGRVVARPAARRAGAS